MLVESQRPAEPGLSYLITKRIMDVVLAAISLVVLSPLILIIALVIKLESPGPAFFLHQRTGQNRRRSNLSHKGGERRSEDRFGRQFELLKFRTMFTDSKERFPKLYEYNYTAEEFRSLIVGKPFPGGESGKLDPRVTKIGGWLRRSSLDELPNLWNVLAGDMSMVGPRPDIWQHIRYYPEDHLVKLQSRPGLTCIAQIMGRGNLTFIETNEHDLAYLSERSFLTDLRILVKTAKSVLLREGAF
jgi:lipopolysaccharide/colanic/teichoic acid biosynthesis glycosyltransferase